MSKCNFGEARVRMGGGGEFSGREEQPFTTYGLSTGPSLGQEHSPRR